MMWLSGEGAIERSLNIFVFLFVAVICSFGLRQLLKPIAQHAPIGKLAFLALAYSLLMGMITVQSGVFLLAVLPPIFGGQAEFKVNIFIIITLGWSTVFVIWSLFYLFLQRQRELQLTKENETRLDTLLTNARLNILHSQISPHFIFNSINNIRALVLEDKNRAREMLASLADILRYSLHSSQSSFVSLGGELEVVEQYLALCSIQYEQRLQQKFEIAEKCLEIQVPKMSIQLLVENAIKHGIAECIEPGVLIINISADEENLFISISNSGELREPEDSRPRVGLSNIKERLNLLYGCDASFVIKQQGPLVVATLIIPIQSNVQRDE